MSVIQGVVRQMMMIAMDGEGDLTALRQLLNMIPDSSSEESNQQMLSMIQGMARQAVRAIVGAEDRTNL